MALTVVAIVVAVTAVVEEAINWSLVPLLKRPLPYSGEHGKSRFMLKILV